MNEDNRVFQCPVCMKGKYKENPLIQHLLDKHPDFPATKKILNEYNFPLACPLCSQKITTPVALMTHYSIYHPHEYQSFKVLLGFDFLNTESTFNSSEALDIIPKLDPTPVYIIQNDTKNLKTLYNLIVITKSPIMHSILKSSDILVICCSKGIILIDLKLDGLGKFLDQYVKGKTPIIEYNTPNDSKELSANYGISISTNIKTNPFTCQNYTLYVRAYGPKISPNEDKQIDINKNISKIDLRLALMNIAIAYHYLISLGFFPVEKVPEKNTQETKNSIKCPCCELMASNTISLYRHLFRQHPFPTMIMNKYKMAEQPKGVFVCDTCHQRGLTSFDDLIVHVYTNHRSDLLKKTINYMNQHAEIEQTYPQLKTFINSEYKLVC